MVIREIRNIVSEILESSGIESFKFETDCILEEVLKQKTVLFNPLEELSEEIVNTAIAYAQKRAEGQPLQYILGHWEFYGLDFFVGEGTLIPRQDTENIIDVLKEYAKNNPPQSIADLCAGSGCIGITLKKLFPDTDVSCIEISESALPYIEKNRSLNMTDINIIKADVLSRETAKKFENLSVIVSNPPYLTTSDMENLQKELTYEPASALYGGSDGLEFYRKISAVWKGSLEKDGIIIYEIGKGQHNDVARILSENGFSDIKFHKDLCGIIRNVSAKAK